MEKVGDMNHLSTNSIVSLVIKFSEKIIQYFCISFGASIGALLGETI